MRVSDYSFGSLKVGDQKVTSDVIVHGDWTHDWWRESGHRVVPSDLEEIVNRSPDVIVFGRGASGRMSVTENATNHLKNKGIDFSSHNTDKAVKEYNRLLKEGKDVAGAFHLTC
jgi:hypothetical protein